MSPAFWRGFWRGLAWPLAWVLVMVTYWLGDAVSRVIRIVPDDWGRTLDVLMPIYQWFMRVSVNLDHACKIGVWQETVPDASLAPPESN